jgi:hypothetical protein
MQSDADKAAARNDVTWTDIGTGVFVKTAGRVPAVSVRLIKGDKTLVSQVGLGPLLAAIDFGVLLRYEDKKIYDWHGELEAEQSRLDENTAEATKYWNERMAKEGANASVEESIKEDRNWRGPASNAKEASDRIMELLRYIKEANRIRAMALYMLAFNAGEDATVGSYSTGRVEAKRALEHLELAEGNVEDCDEHKDGALKGYEHEGHHIEAAEEILKALAGEAGA